MPTDQMLIGAANPPLPEQLPHNWSSLLAGVQSQEPLSPLQELDHISNKRPQLLKHVVQQLYNLISSNTASVRTISITLLLRYVKHDPKISKETLPAILSCLDSQNAEIVNSVLDRLPDIVTSMQEYAKTILSRVFSLGIHSNLNTSGNISKSLALLNLQSGC